MYKFLWLFIDSLLSDRNILFLNTELNSWQIFVSFFNPQRLESRDVEAEKSNEALVKDMGRDGNKGNPNSHYHHFTILH